MKKIFIFLLIGTFLSCNNTNTETEKSVTTVAANMNPPTKLVRDTTPPKQRSNIIIDKARPAAEINKTFPFDIPMTTGNREAINSEVALKPNGKPTVLLFWLTTCYPCKMEMNAIKKEYAKWQEEADFNLYAISTDFPKNYDNFVKRVATEKWPWKAFHDTNREFKRVLKGALNGLPQTFVFDKNGEIVYHKRKYSSGDEHKLFDVVKKYAAQ